MPIDPHTPPAAVSEPVRLLVPSHCQLGEGPFWDEVRRTLFWTDIDAGELHAWHQPTGKVRRVYKGDPVGGFTLEADGALALFRVKDIARFEPDTGSLKSRPFADAGMKRFNDVTADFHGRVFAGTIGRDDASGGLHRLDPDGSSRLLFRGTGVANGMGFSPDGGTFYWTCSTTGRIFAFDYEPSTGELTRRRVFYACSEGEGAPDGLCVDREGTLWSARWGGSCVARHDPASSRIVETVSLPAPCVTSCCFGGPDGGTLFITTARQSEKDPASPAGGVFSVVTPTVGQPSRRSRLF
jgi:D-xylono/L-arabinono-1,4-lactonase